MIQTKLFEVRDRGTFIPVIASKLDLLDQANTGDVATEEEIFLMRRCGYSRSVPPAVFLARLGGSTIATYDPFEWNSNTMRVAHHHIIHHWNELESGAVIDAEFIRGESEKPKVSERVACVG